jgi:hypothetical protein
MTDTATPETGPVDAPASAESIAAEILAGGDKSPADDLEEVTQELVNEAEGTTGDSEEEPGTEDDATEPAEEAAETEEGTPTDQEEPRYTVKVNGEEREVPLSELLGGYSRTEDYKAKTAAVAEERRQVEALKATVEAQTKAEYANQLEEATNLFAQFDPVLSEAQRIDWQRLKSENPEAYVKAQDAVTERLTAIQRMNAEVERLRGETQQHQQAQVEQERVQRFDKAAAVIVEKRPELADEAKFREFAGATVDYLKGEGFTGEEIVDALDHRVLTLADKARRWDAHEAAQKSLPEKKVVPKSAVKPLTSDGSGSSQPRVRFPANADRDRKGDWIAQQILNSE